MTERQAPGTEVRLRYGGIVSVSRALQVVAAVVLLLIVGATVHQLMTLRSAIVGDTARQMARLDMVFAEQTGRAIETVDFILRNAIETLQADGVDSPPPAATFDPLLARRIEGVRQLSDLAITNASGDVIYSAHHASEALPPQGRGSFGVPHCQPAVRLAVQPAVS